MLKIVHQLLYKLLFIVEKIEFYHLKLDNTDFNNKILKTLSVDNLNIKTDTGYQPISHFHITKPYQLYKLKLANGLFLDCADLHQLYDADFNKVYVRDLKKGDLIQTESGLSKIVNISRLDNRISMMDLTVADNNHRYYTNGILSSNTVTSSIMMLWFCIFNNDKNVMIIANKFETTTEILDKIKNIYKLLPVWLKPGVKVWNQRSIVFGDTGCRIKTSARSKEPAIGNTIDFLYLDEFAHIPANIIEHYYKAAFPVVANVENSKVIITSTPNGKNLFWRLFIGANTKENKDITGEKTQLDSEFNPYVSLKIPWDRVKGRNVVWVRLENYLLEKNEITKEYVFDFIKTIYPEAVLKYDENIKKWVINIYSVDIDDIRRLEFQFNDLMIQLIDIAQITSWKLEEIKAIGSEEAFNQEYDLQFLAGSKRLLNSLVLNAINNGISPFETIHFPNEFKRCCIEHGDLKWNTNNQLFKLEQLKDYYIYISIDLAEGLKQDYSIINIFRQVPLTTKEMLQKGITEIENAFRLEQIGIWRSNEYSVQEVADIFYCLVFNVLDPEKTKVVIESNKNFATAFILALQQLYGGENEYSSHIFLKYKHSMESNISKIGLLVSSTRPILVKDYVERMSKGQIRVYEEKTIDEVNGFVRVESDNGSGRWESDTGHDDCVATLINLCTVFSRQDWKNQCEILLEEECSNDFRQAYYGTFENKDNIISTTTDYISNTLKQKNNSNFF